MKAMMKKFVGGGELPSQGAVAGNTPIGIGGAGILENTGGRRFPGAIAGQDIRLTEDGLPFQYRETPPSEFNLTGAPNPNILPLSERLSKFGDVGTEGFYGPLHEAANRNILGEGVNSYTPANFEPENTPIVGTPLDEPAEAPRRGRTLPSQNIQKTGGFQYGRNTRSKGAIGGQGGQGVGFLKNIFGNVNRKPGTAAKRKRAEGGKLTSIDFIDIANQF